MRGVLKIAAMAFAVLLLVGLFVTAVGRWRESANRTRCQFHMGRVGLHALWSYTDPAVFPKEESPQALFNRLPDQTNAGPERLFPPGTVANPELNPRQRLSCYALLLPYLNAGDAPERLNMKQGWESDANREVACTMVPYLQCPSLFTDRNTSVPATTHFIGMAGYGPDAPKLKAADRGAGIFRYDEATRVGALERGLSYTVTFVESSREIGPWAAGGPSTVRGCDPRSPLIGHGAQFGGAHPGGANIAFADGSVRYQSANISPAVFAALVTLSEYGDQ